MHQLSHLLRVIRVEVEAVDAIDDRVQHAPGARGDDREPAGHGLQRHQAKGLGGGGEDEGVGRAIGRDQIVSPQIAGKDHRQPPEVLL